MLNNTKKVAFGCGGEAFHLVIRLLNGRAGYQKSGTYQYERDDFKSAGPTGRICGNRTLFKYLFHRKQNCLIDEM